MKIILSTLIIITVSNAEIGKEVLQGAMLNGFHESITGIFKSTVDLISNPNEAIENAKDYKERKERSQLQFYKKQYKARGKYILKMNEHKNKYLKKYNDLLKENKELKATIKKYNMYYKNEKADKAIKKEEAIKKMRESWRK